MKKGKKKPYLSPKIRSEKVFERRSLACNKSSPNSFPCLQNFKQS